MKKIKLIGVSKSEDLNTYIFPKDPNFFSFIEKLLPELSFDSNDYYYECFGENTNEKNFKEFLEKTYDKIWAAKQGNYLLEIIIGKDRIFVLIYTKKDLQQEISKIISKLTTK